MQFQHANILIVDDEPDLCEIYADYAEELGLTPLTAVSGEEALEILEQEDIHLIMTDIKMPGMSGLLFIQEKRDRGFEQPVIICSASIPDHIGLTEMKHDANIIAFLEKPLDETEFEKAVTKALPARQSAS